MEAAKKAVSELHDAEFDQFLYWVLNEHRDERKQRKAEAQARAKMLAELIEAGKLDGARFVSREDALSGGKVPSWRNPNGDEIRMFPHGAVVSRYSKVYENTLEGELNGYEPGGKDTPEGAWLEITGEVKAAAEAVNRVDLLDEPDSSA